MDGSRKKELIAAYKQRKIVGCVYEVACAGNGRFLVRQDSDAEKAGNRFAFSQSTGSCLLGVMQKDWDAFGPASFTFRIVETLEKKDTQSDREFAEDLAALAELVRERYAPETLYPVK